jgi:hypothetical protein
MAYRESDQLILLYEIEEGADRILSLQRITFAGQAGLEEQMQTSLQGIAKKAILICLLRKRVSLKSPVR